MIVPKIFHRIWLGPKPLPEYAVHYGESWRQHHPDWQMWLWTDDNIQTILPNLKNTKVLEDSTNPGHRSDVLRLEILYQCGGVYMDCDVECQQSIESWIEHQQAFVATLTQPHISPDVRVENGLMGCVAQHPFWHYMLERLDEWYWSHHDDFITTRTGPHFVDQSLWDWQGQGRVVFGSGVALMPNHFVFHRKLWQIEELQPVPNNAVAVHHTMGSWVTSDMRF